MASYSDSQAEWRLSVDPANPGQFLACCGLLELADRLWPGAEGCFQGNAFLIRTQGTLSSILRALLACETNEVTELENGLPVKPLIAPLHLRLDAKPGFELTLDAWMTIKHDKGNIVTAANPPWNFWSGQQTSLRIWKALRSEFDEQLRIMDDADLPLLFSHRVLLSGRFGFDPGAAWNALDVGFSPNEQKIEVASSPAVELLAAIGLQRFRPNLLRDRSTFTYATWSTPLAPAVALAAATGVLGERGSTQFVCRVVSRGSYAALGQSIPFSGEHNGRRLEAV